MTHINPNLSRRTITTPGTNAIRRHVIIDNINKVIYIEIPPDIKGNVNQNEIVSIRLGNWHHLVPTEYAATLAQSVNNGYRVEAVLMMGHENEKYRVLQFTDLKFEQKS